MVICGISSSDIVSRPATASPSLMVMSSLLILFTLIWIDPLIMFSKVLGIFTLGASKFFCLQDTAFIFMSLLILAVISFDSPGFILLASLRNAVTCSFPLGKPNIIGCIDLCVPSVSVFRFTKALFIVSTSDPKIRFSCMPLQTTTSLIHDSPCNPIFRFFMIPFISISLPDAPLRTSDSWLTS